MGITELAKLLNIGKSTVHKFAQRGMPMNSVEAAQAWRLENAKPRRVNGKVNLPVGQAMIVNSQSVSQPPDDSIGANDPEKSLIRAKNAETAAHNILIQCEKSGGSIEDYRKANAVYIAARNNWVRAEKDFREWQHQNQVTLYVDEAKEIASRPLNASRSIIETMPKGLAPRLYGQPQKEIERTLADFASRLIETMRASLWNRTDQQ